MRSAPARWYFADSTGHSPGTRPGLARGSGPGSSVSDVLIIPLPASGAP